MWNREQEFKEAFERHADELFRHASLRISNRERAVELTQECFARAWEYLERGERIEQYRPFLYRTLNNLIVDEYRKRKSLSLDAMLEDEDHALSVEGKLLRDETDLLEEQAVRFEAREAVRGLELIPESYRVVIVMRYIDGLSPREIAEILGQSENAVSVRIHRGLRKLQGLLSSSPHATDTI